VGYIFAADSIYASPSILKQGGLKTGASLLNAFTRKTVFNANWLFRVIEALKVICFDVSLGDYILRHN